MTSSPESPDRPTADAFAFSWNTVGGDSVYTREQFEDWFAPVDPASLAGCRILEMGFGNGSLLYHVARCAPLRLTGIELGNTFERTRRNLSGIEGVEVELVSGDLTTTGLGTFDFVYSIGVFHHLTNPDDGFRAMLRATRPGGRFHGWVYAREGNEWIRALVEPIRRIACRLPPRFTKWFVALPLVVPYFLYARVLRALLGPRDHSRPILAGLPLREYSLWIAERDFPFFHHVAFDQLVTPRTAYIPRVKIDEWLSSADIEPASRYIVFRNGNSWKFGGRKNTS